MKVLEAGPEPGSDRPTSKILHDEPGTRIVAFSLLPGQVIPPHRSPSTVTVVVTTGSGTFEGEGGAARLEIGESAVYAPNELHAIRAGEESLGFLALITPRPR